MWGWVPGTWLLYGELVNCPLPLSAQRAAGRWRNRTMSTLSDEHLRALRFLARHPGGCTEATLLKQGFTTGQLGHLVYAGFAKLRRGGGHTSAKVFRVKITEAGQRAIAE
jgi:hypothetical protein